MRPVDFRRMHSPNRRSYLLSNRPLPEVSTKTRSDDKFIKAHRDIIALEIREAVGSRIGSKDTPEEHLENQKQLVRTMKVPYKINLFKRSGGDITWLKALKPIDAVEKLQDTRMLAIGDLHASSRKLLETLVMNDMVYMHPGYIEKFLNLSEEIVPRTYAGPITEDLQRVYPDIKALVPKMKWIGGDRQIVLIGDVLADRGLLDTLTLDMIEHLSKDKPERFVRICGNHDLDAVFHYNGLESIYEEQNPSLHAAFKLAKAMDEQSAGTKHQDELKERYKSYLSQSKLLHFDSDTASLYLHAPVSKEELINFVGKLKEQGCDIPPYQEWTRNNLPGTISAINREFTKFVDKYMSKASSERPKVEVQKELFGSPFFDFVWARNALKRSNNHPFSLQDHGVAVMAHGHHDGDEGRPVTSTGGDGKAIILNLDNEVWKGNYHFESDNDKSPLYAVAATQ